MNFLKFNGQIYKVTLSAKEQKAMDEEINRQLIAKHKEFTDDFDYMILRVLYQHFEFDLDQLKAAYNLFVEDNDALIKHYEMPDAGVYIARQEMNKIGCDIEKWNKERGE